jgi:hypothetical protein
MVAPNRTNGATSVGDLQSIRAEAQRIRENARDGYQTLPMEFALARFVMPVLRLLDEMESGRMERWLTLQEMENRTGWSRKYFIKPLGSLGGVSRLQAWKQEGRADKAEPGVWLICPTKAPPPRPGFPGVTAAPEGAKSEEIRPTRASQVQDIADFLMR